MLDIYLELFLKLSNTDYKVYSKQLFLPECSYKNSQTIMIQVFLKNFISVGISILVNQELYIL